VDSNSYPGRSARTSWCARDAGPWQVKRVEEYIEANLDAPFNIEQIAELTGISTRSIYRAFKRSRGYSPMQFARQRRLQQARRMPEGAGQVESVTSVAFRCGFNASAISAGDSRRSSASRLQPCSAAVSAGW